MCMYKALIILIRGVILYNFPYREHIGKFRHFRQPKCIAEKIFQIPLMNYTHSYFQTYKGFYYFY